MAPVGQTGSLGPEEERHRPSGPRRAGGPLASAPSGDSHRRSAVGSRSTLDEEPARRSGTRRPAAGPGRRARVPAGRRAPAARAPPTPGPTGGRAGRRRSGRGVPPATPKAAALRNRAPMFSWSLSPSSTATTGRPPPALGASAARRHHAAGSTSARPTGRWRPHRDGRRNRRWPPPAPGGPRTPGAPGPAPHRPGRTAAATWWSSTRRDGPSNPEREQPLDGEPPLHHDDGPLRLEATAGGRVGEVRGNRPAGHRRGRPPARCGRSGRRPGRPPPGHPPATGPAPQSATERGDGLVEGRRRAHDRLGQHRVGPVVAADVDRVTPGRPAARRRWPAPGRPAGGQGGEGRGQAGVVGLAGQLLGPVERQVEVAAPVVDAAEPAGSATCPR